MGSCWSNIPSARPSFDNICDTLEAVLSWLESEEGVADPGGSPLGQERQNTAIFSPLQRVVQESRPESDESVGSLDSGGFLFPTPSGIAHTRVCSCKCGRGCNQ